MKGSVGDHVEAGAARLEAAGVCLGQGTLEPYDEAAWIVLWALGRPLDSLDSCLDEPVAIADSSKIATLFDRRIQERVPTAYLTGEAWLQGVPFFVDPRTIIPRSFIAEVLADGALDAWLPASGEAVEVLDLCTGNGSLAVLAALAWPQAKVWASDLSADALDVARRNVHRHGLQARITLACGDTFATVPGPFDLILCNPPYVNTDSMTHLPPEFRAEPALALAGGPDGMDFVRRMLIEAPRHLRRGGALVLEIGHERRHFDAAFPDLMPLWLETSAGGDQVMLLERAQLPRAGPQ